MSDSTAQRGFALLIKAPGVIRTFEPLKGETIEILDAQGNVLWSFKLPVPMENPGINLHEVNIDLLTERDFGEFCKRTWSRSTEASG